ncbi:MAG: ribose-phosphate pyrophosphokinase [Verrucomicrobiota bacterium]
MPSQPTKLKILTGTAHPELAKRIAASLGTEVCDATVNCFPDGESFVKINENIRGRDVFIVQPTCPSTNHNLMELLIMIDAALRASADRITAVIPFFGYARQDRKDQPRVPITAKLVANLITKAGADRVLTMDLHAGQIQGFFDIPVDHLYAMPVLIDYLRDLGLENLTVVSPDVGGLKMSDAYAKALDAPLAIVGKRRISATQVEAISLIGDIEDRNVIIVDDMTETAGTLLAASNLLAENGAKKIFAGVSHAVLGNTGRERLAASRIEKLVTTNSVPMASGEKVVALCIADLLGEAIKRIHNYESVTSLFDISG